MGITSAEQSEALTAMQRLKYCHIQIRGMCVANVMKLCKQNVQTKKRDVPICI